MQHKITSVADLGVLVRAARKSSGVRIDDLASMVGMSKQNLNDFELGKPGVKMGNVLTVLQELGLYLYVDAPESTAQHVQSSSEHIARTHSRRRARQEDPSVKGKE